MKERDDREKEFNIIFFLTPTKGTNGANDRRDERKKERKNGNTWKIGMYVEKGKILNFKISW